MTAALSEVDFRGGCYPSARSRSGKYYSVSGRLYTRALQPRATMTALGVAFRIFHENDGRSWRCAMLILAVRYLKWARRWTA